MELYEKEHDHEEWNAAAVDFFSAKQFKKSVDLQQEVIVALKQEIPTWFQDSYYHQLPPSMKIIFEIFITNSNLAEENFVKKYVKDSRKDLEAGKTEETLVEEIQELY